MRMVKIDNIMKSVRIKSVKTDLIGLNLNAGFPVRNQVDQKVLSTIESEVTRFRQVFVFS